MPAEELRAVAKRLRELAGAATPGPWEAVGRLVEQSAGDYADVIGSQVECMAYCYGGTPVLPKREDAAYIAAMHPGVGLGVAAWLEAEAGAFEIYESANVDPAVAVARAILGTGEAGE